MKIAVLGTGAVGQAIGSKLIELGHNVVMGSRTATNEKATAWKEKNGANASIGTFSDAANFGEIIFNCTNGNGTMEAIAAAGAENLNGKILIDISNPLDFSAGFPPTLSVSNTDSLGEQIQRAYPNVKVVKTLNTINCEVMVNPALLPGVHDVFMSGNDQGAKATVATILREWFGWQSVVDLGDISTARGAEMILPLWIRVMGAIKTPMFNFKLVKQE
jgi:8-hydroxy-5-deazaflavin:NADPH oxidoreductase